MVSEMGLSFVNPHDYRNWIEVVLVCTDPGIRLGLGTILLLYSLLWATSAGFDRSYLKVANVRKNRTAVEFYKRLFYHQIDEERHPERMVLLDHKQLIQFDLNSLILRTVSATRRKRRVSEEGTEERPEKRLKTTVSATPAPSPSLPPDLLLRIASFLPPADLLTVVRLSRSLRGV